MRRLVLAIALCVALGVAAAPALAARWVSYPVLLEQIRSGPVVRAVINRTLGNVEIKFRDLSEWEAHYPRAEQPALQRLLHARHIRVLFATRPHAKHARPAAVHHHLRYIAAGVLAAIVLTSAGLYLYLRRRRGVPQPGGAREP